jgi:hypothetical protein
LTPPADPTKIIPPKLKTHEVVPCHWRKGGPILLASDTYHHIKFRGDPWQAVGMYQRLRAKGIPVEEFTFTPTSASRIAVGLFTALRDGLVDLPSDDDLIDELAAVKLVERSPNSWKLDTAAGKHDDQAIVLAMACDHLMSRTTGVVRLHSTARRSLEPTSVGSAARSRGWSVG